MQSEFGQGTILSFLQDVLSGKIAVKAERLAVAPRVNVSERKVVGTIVTPIARQFVLLGLKIHEEIQRIIAAHTNEHERGHHDPNQCREIHALIDILGRRLQIVRDLSWQYVYAEFPSLVGENVSLGRNWEAHVSIDTNLSSKALFAADHPVTTFVNDLELVLTGNSIIDIHVGLKPIADGETVIGTVDDPIIRRLWALSNRMIADLPNSEEELDRIMRETKLGDIDDIMNRFRAQKALVELTRDMFWAAVRDTIPASNDPEDVGIRENWQLVSIPEKAAGQHPLVEALAEMLLGRGAATIFRL